MKPLQLFSFFHLNLMFSSIEEEARPEVIRRCYWPLLQLAAGEGGPLGIELTGYTLETILALDPAWVTELRRLIGAGQVELIGSGYAQLIGPLVPAAVNRANQRLGREVYRDLLGVAPAVALVNEQAWSAGLVDLYREAGYRAVIMEWDNPAAGHPEWPSAARYYPQRAQGCGDESIPLIWNQSIAFQKFQRYAHGELELEEMLAYLQPRLGEDDRAWALYGNDAEIFDHRPGRFHTEAALAGDEWQRIAALYRTLRTDNRFRLVAPSAVLPLLDAPSGGQLLRLETTAQPVPVKKQAKYNILRWAVSGRDDLDLNSRCHRLLATLGAGGSDADWKELCYLWSSDFRTHITDNRWQVVQERLAAMEARLALPPGPVPADDGVSVDPTAHQAGPFRLQWTERRLVVESDALRLTFNLRRGLALEALQRPGAAAPLIGTLEHGFYDDIGFGADFYTGHMVFEMPGQHKVTDLVPVSPTLHLRGDGALVVAAEVSTPFGDLSKRWIIDPAAATVELVYHFRWPRCPRGALRLGHITLHPAGFDREALWLRTHNGGAAEHFSCPPAEVNHLTPVSTLISASQGLGMTEGWIACGDSRRQLQLQTDPAAACVTAHLHAAPVGDSTFFRLTFSLQETDDTSARIVDRASLADRVFRLRLQCLETTK